MRIVRNILMLAILLFLLFMSISGIRGYVHPNPVCHAITEDSVITDCDYHNGAWWTK